MHLEEGWKTVLVEYGVSWVILPSRSPLVQALQDRMIWISVGHDKTTSILRNCKHWPVSAYSLLSKGKAGALQYSLNHGCQKEVTRKTMPARFKTDRRSVSLNNPIVEMKICFLVFSSPRSK